MSLGGDYLTPEQQEAVTNNLDDWVRQQADQAVAEFQAQHAPDLAGGTTDGPGVGGDGGSRTPPASPPVPDPNGAPPPLEYQVGHVRIPQSDADLVARAYAFIRNNADGQQRLEQLITSPPEPPPWQQTQVPPPPANFLPPPPAIPSTYYPPPGYPTAPPTPVVPPNLDLEDPNVRYLYEQNQRILAQQEEQRRNFEAWQTQQQAEIQRQNQETARRARDQMVLEAVKTGGERFASRHPELDEGVLAQISSYVASTNLVGGLSQRMPWDQAVEEAMELAAPRVLTSRPPVGSTPTEVQRQRSLTALSGSTGSAGTRTESTTPPPGDRMVRKNIGDDEFVRAAREMIQRTGLPLGSTI